jgi:hypothetical protein
VTGTDPICNAPVNDPKKTGEIWIQGGDIVPFSSPVCTLLGVKKYGAEGKKFNAVYLVDHQLGIKVFADAAFYSVGGRIRRSRTWCRSCSRRMRKPMQPRTAASWRPTRSAQRHQRRTIGGLMGSMASAKIVALPMVTSSPIRAAQP